MESNQNAENQTDPAEKKRLEEERDRNIDRIIDPFVTDYRHTKTIRPENTSGITFHQ
jgi:hypothetical protein